MPGSDPNPVQENRHQKKSSTDGSLLRHIQKEKRCAPCRAGTVFGLKRFNDSPSPRPRPALRFERHDVMRPRPRYVSTATMSPSAPTTVLFDLDDTLFDHTHSSLAGLSALRNQ